MGCIEVYVWNYPTAVNMVTTVILICEFALTLTHGTIMQPNFMSVNTASGRRNIRPEIVGMSVHGTKLWGDNFTLAGARTLTNLRRCNIRNQELSFPDLMIEVYFILNDSLSHHFSL